MVAEDDEKVVKIKDDTTKDSEAGKSKSPPFSNYWRILSYGSRIEHGGMLIGLFCATASGVALPLMNIVFGSLVGDFNNYFIPGGGVTENRFKSAVARNALYIVYLFVGKFVLTYVAIFCFRIVGLRISAALRLSYMRALFAQPVKKLDEISSGTVSHTITSNSNTIQMSISDRLNHLFQGLALVIAAYAIAFRYSWQLTLATSAGILFIIGIYGVISPFTLRAQKEVDKADAKHATVASEVMSSIRTVFSLGAQEKLTKKYDEGVAEAHRAGMKMAPQLGLQLTPMFFAIYASYSLAFWFGLKLYAEGHIAGVGTVIIVFFSVLIVTSVMNSLVVPLMYVTKAISASTSFFDMIDSEKQREGGLKDPDVTPNGDIELNNITFAYPTRSSVDVLKDFSATFKAGKTTALVGPSGSGKSTIVALLERWYELNGLSTDTTEQHINAEDATNPAKVEDSSAKGSILVGGQNVNGFDIKWWRSRIGLVQQEPFLFNESIEKNVAYGLIGTEWEDAEPAKKSELVKAACKEAFADEFISKLPKGYSSIVGDAGIRLSGGQRQRIAIARSMIRQPAVLILDEATSSIDVQGERTVQEALDRLAKNRTTIMIAHRLSTIRKADHIVVLRSGTKIEEGTHEQLLSMPDGLYHSLIRAQELEEEQTAPENEDSQDTTYTLGTSVSRQTSKGSRAFHRTISAVADKEQALPASGYKVRGFFGTVGLLLYEQRSHWPFYVAMVGAAMGCGAAYAIQSWLFAQLVQTFLYTGQRLTDARNFWALMFFVLALAVAVCYGILGFSSTATSTHIGTESKKQYFRDTIKMPISYFDQEEHSVSTVVSRLSTDPKQLQELLGLNGAFPLISMFNVIGSLIVSYYFGWKLTIVVMFGVMPVILGGSFVRTRYEVRFEQLEAEVFAGSAQFATEIVGAFRTVTSLVMEQTVVDKYEELLKVQIRKSTQKASYAMLIYALSDSIDLCGMALTFWYGGQLLASREYQPLQFYVIFAALIQGAQAAGSYLSIIPNVARSTTAANRVLKLRKEVADLNLSSTKIAKPSQAGLGAKIEFKDVSFKYPTYTTNLFSHLNITIQPGQFVAFVGPSGCGKTTTISLLERFYDIDSGTITFDDEDISTFNPQSYRRKISLVAQEPRLFSGTIRSNLLLGVDEDSSTITEKMITDACRAAEIHDFITSLPEGYATDLGLNTQTQLSGGQKQRLCLARALLRRPKLLLLDEATSSLDSQSERLVQGAIERLADQRSMTVIAVAHRLATIQKADVIFVFGERDVETRNGTKIVEMGTHRELLARRGVYWGMCQIQTLDR